MKRELLRLRVVAELVCRSDGGDVAAVEETTPAFLYPPFGAACERIVEEIREALHQLERQELAPDGQGPREGARKGRNKDAARTE